MNEAIDDWVAIVCKRGHIITRITEGFRVGEYGNHCGDCGAALYDRCPNCGRPLAIINVGADPSPFCIGCGLPFPWATREQIVYHVQNQLDRVDLDGGDRRVLQEQLNELFMNPDDKDTEKRQLRVLQKVKEMAPAFYRDVIVPTVTPLITAWMKHEMGLPPG